MTNNVIQAPQFDFSAAVTQMFNLPGGKGYLFRVIGFGTLLLSAAFVLLGIPIVKAYVSMFRLMMELDLAEGLSDAEEAEAMMKVMAPIFASMGFFFLLYIIQFGTYISVETAIYRNIIRGEDKGFFPLRFGGDECKVLLTRIVVALILYAVFFAVYFGGAIFGFILFGLGAATESAAIMGIAGILVTLLVLAAIGGLIYGAIRLAPSAAFTVRDVDFTPIGSWSPMKTYFWPTLGSFLVVGVVGYIALIIVYFLAFGILVATSGILPALSSLEAEEGVVPDFSPVLDTLASAGFIIPSIIFGVVLVAFSLLYLGAIWSIWGYIAKLTERREGTIGAGEYN